MDTENLPAVQEFPLPEKLKDAGIPFLDVQMMNVHWDYFIFCKIAEAWKKADTITEIGMCQHLTNTQIEKHRNHLGYPNAYEATSKKTALVYPID